MNKHKPQKNRTTHYLVALLVVQATLAGMAGPQASTADDQLPPNRRHEVRKFPLLDRWTRTYERSNSSVMNAFRSVVEQPRLSTVEVLCKGRQACLGTVVSADGLILTKASELSSDLEVRTHDRSLLRAKLIAERPDYDLAFLKIDKVDLTPIRWRKTRSPLPGSWLATTGLKGLPVAIGVVSAAPRPIPPSRGYLGVQLDAETEGIVIDFVYPASSAATAGLRPGDIINHLNSQKVADVDDFLTRIRRLRPGDRVRVEFERGGSQQAALVTLGDAPKNDNGKTPSFYRNLGREVSRRHTRFPLALQHDTILRPYQCGGPVVDLDGSAVGINIASADRISTYALPAAVVVPLIDHVRDRILPVPPVVQTRAFQDRFVTEASAVQQ